MSERPTTSVLSPPVTPSAIVDEVFRREVLNERIRSEKDEALQRKKFLRDRGYLKNTCDAIETIVAAGFDASDPLAKIDLGDDPENGQRVIYALETIRRFNKTCTDVSKMIMMTRVVTKTPAPVQSNDSGCGGSGAGAGASASKKTAPTDSPQVRKSPEGSPATLPPKKRHASENVVVPLDVISNLTSCLRCKKTAIDAMQCSKQHVVCDWCVGELKHVEKRFCPVECCTEELCTFKPAHAIRTLVSTLPQKCTQCRATDADGIFEGTKDEIAQHQISGLCGGEMVECPQKKCTTQLKRRNVTSHLDNECTRRTVACPFTKGCAGRVCLADVGHIKIPLCYCLEYACIFGCGPCVPAPTHVLANAQMVEGAEIRFRRLLTEHHSDRAAIDRHIAELPNANTAVVLAPTTFAGFAPAASDISRLPFGGKLLTFSKKFGMTTQTRNKTDVRCGINMAEKKIFVAWTVVNADTLSYCICATRFTVVGSHASRLHDLPEKIKVSVVDTPNHPNARQKTGDRTVFLHTIDLAGTAFEKNVDNIEMRLITSLRATQRSHCVACAHAARTAKEAK